MEEIAAVHRYKECTECRYQSASKGTILVFKNPDINWMLQISPEDVRADVFSILAGSPLYFLLALRRVGEDDLEARRVYPDEMRVCILENIDYMRRIFSAEALEVP